MTREADVSRSLGLPRAMPDNALPTTVRGTTMHKGLASGIVACALLAGCAAMHPQVPRESKQRTCEAGSACTIDVHVECDRFVGCALSVDYDLVLVKGPGSKTDIVWRLTGDTAARFADLGIALDSSEFECMPQPEAREFRCTDKHTVFGVFKYRVNVTLPKSVFGPRGVPSLDAWIVND